MNIFKVVFSKQAKNGKFQNKLVGTEVHKFMVMNQEQTETRKKTYYLWTDKALTIGAEGPLDVSQFSQRIDDYPLPNGEVARLTTLVAR